MKVACIIPSRYGSTRLPGKPLVDICGKPMIQRVYEQVQKAQSVDEVIVATDDDRVYKAVESFQGQVVMTRSDHETGTDRLAEVAKSRPDIDVIINVQGDEPLIDPSIIEELVAYFREDPQAKMATVATELEEEEANNPNAVKVVTDVNGNCLYFSRSLIPYPRNGGPTPWKHIGIYGYQREFLLAFSEMDQTPLEKCESLEQLRALERGYTIRLLTSHVSLVGVDTPADLERVRALIKEREEDYENH